jgi:hypothetical protein
MDEMFLVEAVTTLRNIHPFGESAFSAYTKDLEKY